MLEQGPTEKVILEQCYRNKMPLPESIKNAPELLPGLELFYGAFFDLTSCRTGLHSTEGPIKWTAMDRWAERYQLDDEQWEDLVYHLGQMDEAYLKFKTKKLSSLTKPPPTRGKK